MDNLLHDDLLCIIKEKNDDIQKAQQNFLGTAAFCSHIQGFSSSWMASLDDTLVSEPEATVICSLSCHENCGLHKNTIRTDFA